jgi:hypothetical protein
MQLRKENSFVSSLGMRISPVQRFYPKQLLNVPDHPVRVASHMVAALILSKGTAP